MVQFIARFFCIDATLLCELESDKMWINEFEQNRSRLIAWCNRSYNLLIYLEVYRSTVFQEVQNIVLFDCAPECVWPFWMSCRAVELKPGLHIVVIVAEHACDDASERILKLSKYQLQVFFLWNINTYDHPNDMQSKPYLDSLKNMFANKCLRSLRLIWRPGLKNNLFFRRHKMWQISWRHSFVNSHYRRRFLSVLCGAPNN